MLKRYVLMGVLATSFAGAGVAAQGQATPAQQPPATERPETTQRPETTPSQPATSATQPSQRPEAMGASTKLTGCVYREEDVPGRTPNVAERAGVMEDYILADVKAGSESASASGSTSTPGAVGTSGAAAKMFKLEHVADERLKSFVGKRVEVVGRIDAEAGDAAANRAAGATSPAAGDASAGPDRVNLPEFEVTEIREVAGDCAAKPDAGR